MSGPVRASIYVAPNGSGSLLLNGVDYSGAVVGFRLECRAGRGAVLHLEMTAVEVTLDAADVRVTADGPVDVPANPDPEVVP